MPKRVRVYQGSDVPVEGETESSIWRDWGLDLKLVYLWICLTGIFLAIPFLASSPFLIIFLIPVISFIPGYCLTAALYPGLSISILRRVVFSIGSSMVVVSLILLALRISPWGIQRNPVIVFLCILSVIMTLIAQNRRAELPEEERFRLVFQWKQDESGTGAVSSNTDRNNRALVMLLIFLVLTVILGTAALYLNSNPGNHETVNRTPLVSGCATRPDSTVTLNNTVTPVFAVTITQTAIPVSGVTLLPIPVPEGTMGGARDGHLNISLGSYGAVLPVFIDGVNAGNVSPGKPLSFSLSEGSHSVKICSGTVCEQATVHIGYAITTSLDFEESLNTDAPQGLLTITTGDYPGIIPVFIDNSSAGVVSPDSILNQTISTGPHVVQLCVQETCFDEHVDITPANRTSLDFEDRLVHDLPQGSLMVSIGGYNAHLPVFVDDTEVGTASMGQPVDLRMNIGNHTVRVCIGKVCEEDDAEVRFAKQTVVDFEARLKRDAEFPTPTVRIRDYSLSGSSMSVNVEFINPENTDHSITATVSCVYTYTDTHNTRRSDAAQNRIIRSLKAGERVTQRVSLSLTGGSNVIANEPVISDVIIK